VELVGAAPLRRLQERFGFSEAEPAPATAPRSRLTPGRRRAGRLPRVNFVEDVMERFPRSRLGIVAVDADGNARDWHFGELIARSAGLSGAFAARGVRRGDVVMTLVGNRIEWALPLLACWRMGAVALPCSPQLRRHDLELRRGAAAPALCVGASDCSASCPTRCRR
jgi:acyl-coenzyme A synthetase/AMP-(fatty) acid ligase